MEIGKSLKSVLPGAKNFTQIDKDFIKAKLQALTQLQSGAIKTLEEHWRDDCDC
jgi:hypothetical protein